MGNDIEYPMKLSLRDADSIQFTCLADLSKVIPENHIGKPLNYGQGEGQVEVNGTVWGFYLTDNGSYYMQFEEGNLEWRALNALVESIIATIDKSFGISARIDVQGPFTNRTDV